jgi:hypothetical protein
MDPFLPYFLNELGLVEFLHYFSSRIGQDKL